MVVNSQTTTELPDGKIKVDFSIGETPFVLIDALVIPAGSMTEAEITAEIEQRYADWIAFVTE